MKKISKYLADFLKYLENEKRRSQKTVENYNFYIKRFIEWWGDKTPEKISSETIKKYRIWLGRLVDVHGEPLKKNTQNYHFIALRSFLKYLKTKKIKTASPKDIDLFDVPKRRLQTVEGSELERLLAAPISKNTEKASIMACRDKALLEFLFSTGLRVSETAQIKKNELDWKKNELVIKSKSKPRTVFLSSQAKYWLKKYLEKRKDSNPYLFIAHDKRTGASNDKDPLTPRSIQRTVQKYALMAGINKQVTPHTLRHTYARQLLKNGADIKDLQGILGHSSLTATQFYDKK